MDSEKTPRADVYAEERNELLERVDTALEEAIRKVEQGRVYDAENEKVRIKWIRAVGYLIRTKRQVLKDKELEEMQERIDQLEGQVNGR